MLSTNYLHQTEDQKINADESNLLFNNKKTPKKTKNMQREWLRIPLITEQKALLDHSYSSASQQ